MSFFKHKRSPTHVVREKIHFKLIRRSLWPYMGEGGRDNILFIPLDYGIKTKFSHEKVNSFLLTPLLLSQGKSKGSRLTHSLTGTTTWVFKQSFNHGVGATTVRRCSTIDSYHPDDSVRVRTHHDLIWLLVDPNFWRVVEKVWMESWDDIRTPEKMGS